MFFPSAMATAKPALNASPAPVVSTTGFVKLATGTTILSTKSSQSHWSIPRPSRTSSSRTLRWLTASMTFGASCRSMSLPDVEKSGIFSEAYGQTSCCASRQMTTMVGRLLTYRFPCGISGFPVYRLRSLKSARKHLTQSTAV